MKCLSASSFFGLSTLRFLWTAGFLLSALPAIAQYGGEPPRPGSATQPSANPPQPPPAITPWDKNDLIYGKDSKQVSSKIGKDDNCFLPPLSGLAPAAVRVSELQIPAKAKRDHEDGCLALRKGKIVEAESHFRKAVNRSAKYSASWVVLGQVLEAQLKLNEAADTCSRPLTTEPKYLPSYLCLADISAHSESWDKVLSLSIRALAIDPSTLALAYDYNAAANLHLHNLPEAKKSALRAVEIDKSNTDPRVHFLLAQIYEAEGDRTGEAAQLREYLKYASDPNDIGMVEKYLSELKKPTK